MGAVLPARRFAAVQCMLLAACASLAESPTASPSTKSRQAEGGSGLTVRISFFHDADLNGRRDPGEAGPAVLDAIASGPYRKEEGGSILVGPTQELALKVTGRSWRGKALQVAVMGDPPTLTMLPMLRLSVQDRDLDIGLADGFLTSPLAPPHMNLADYESVLRDPEAWNKQCDPLFPKDWPYERNYFFYGYRISAGPLEGQPHLAFDLWALPGTPVLAAAPGTIVPGLYDWRFGIEGPYGVAYYNHIVPAVKVGDRVERYQVVGWIAEGQGNHVHFELRPDPGRILEAFPGMGAEDLLKSPVRGEAVTAPAWFGEEPLSAPQEPTAPTIGGWRTPPGSERRP